MPPRGNNHTVRRLVRELESVVEEEDLRLEPVSTDNMFLWHFTLRGPPDGDFHEGVYHGKVVIPPDYPFSPPDFVFLTPSGRFEKGRKICLSATSFHPESWQPAWTIPSILRCVQTMFETPSAGALGGLDSDPTVRRQLASASATWRCPDCKKRNEDVLSPRASRAEREAERERANSGVCAPVSDAVASAPASAPAGSVGPAREVGPASEGAADARAGEPPQQEKEESEIDVPVEDQQGDGGHSWRRLLVDGFGLSPGGLVMYAASALAILCASSLWHRLPWEVGPDAAQVGTRS